MAQEFHVLKCHACIMFQVHIVKKINKWICKICNTKQSVIKVYGQGTATNCRKLVQKLNELNNERNTPQLDFEVSGKILQTKISEVDFTNDVNDSNDRFLPKSKRIKSNVNDRDYCENKWSKYLKDEDGEIHNNFTRNVREIDDINCDENRHSLNQCLTPSIQGITFSSLEELHGKKSPENSYKSISANEIKDRSQLKCKWRQSIPKVAILKPNSKNELSEENRRIPLVEKSANSLESVLLDNKLDFLTSCGNKTNEKKLFQFSTDVKINIDDILDI